MKLSVRTKLANGLVIFLLMPRAAETAVNLFDTYSEGFKSFSADDEFQPLGEKGNNAGVTVKADPAGDVLSGDPTGGDPTGGDPTGGDPTGGDPTGGDPTGGDPTGGDPTGGDPTGGDPTGGDPTGGDPSGGVVCLPGSGVPTLLVEAPTELITAEDGSADHFEVFMVPDPAITRFFHFVSTVPDEAQPVPSMVTFKDNACDPQPIWVVGQNDGLVDGDIDFEIEIRDEDNFLVGTIPGVNLDNDNYTSIAVDVLGPPTLPEGDSGVFTVRATNVSRNDLRSNNFVIEATRGLRITGYAASLLSGKPFTAKAKLKKDELSFSKVDLDAGDVLLVSVDVLLKDGGPQAQKLTAHFFAHPKKKISDDDQTLETAVP